MSHTVSSWLVKYSAPSKLCLEPYGQIWQQINDDGLYTLWVQVSKKEDEAHWLKMGEFLEKVYADRIKTDRFMAQCFEELDTV